MPPATAYAAERAFAIFESIFHAADTPEFRFQMLFLSPISALLLRHTMLLGFLFLDSQPRFCRMTRRQTFSLSFAFE